ncbi:MAG TPA: polyamine ABC transporter substrate-binding protein [Terriglobia bacterium]|nr:polyamine ABC transporter substrate-binding protein [Terriglobia bacterium]
MKKFRFGAVAFVTALLIAGCGEKKKEEQAQSDQSSAPAASAPATTSTPAPAPADSQQAAATPSSSGNGEQKLNVYNWSDYIGEHTVEDFEKATGIKVQYDVYDSNEALEAKLMAGNTGYDIVVPTGPFLGRQIKAGIYQKIDKTKLKNYGNLDPLILQAEAAFDPGNEYAVPYFWGTVGIGINVDKVKQRLGDNAPVDSLDLLLKPEYADKLKDCGVTMLDSPSDIFPLIFNYLGKDPHTTSPDDFAAAQKVMQGIRPDIKYFHSSSYINDLANGEVCAVLGWSGDVFIAASRAADAKNGNNIEYHIPKEGSLLWVDNLAIPKDAQHVDNALKFIDNLLDPKVAAAGVNFVTYPSSVKLELMPDVSPDIAKNPGIYPTDDVKKKLFPDKIVDAETERLRTRTWTTIKTGQ